MTSTLFFLLFTAIQAHDQFRTGLDSYYLFWFDKAIKEFQECLDSNPLCLLGSALAFKQPLWHNEDLGNASVYLNRIDTQAVCLNSAERKQLVNKNSGLEGLECDLSIGISAYLDPLQDAWKREQGWMDFMERLYQEYPQNLDISALYAISSLGLAANAPNYISMKEAEEITNRTRVVLRQAVELDGGINHAGILHFLTHADDSMDPEVAIQGLAYGERLAQVFNYSAHAVHMVSHLYLTLSNWSKVIDVNERAYSASKAYCNAQGGSKVDRLRCDKDDKYHALEWTHYALLQQESCDLEMKLSLDKVREMGMIWKQEPGNIDYQNWMLRIYARQKFKELECGNRNIVIQSCFKEFPLEKRIVIGNSWIPRVSITNDYWVLYSSAGAYLAWFFAELFSENGYNLNVLEKINSEMNVISSASQNQTFIDKLHLEYSQITFFVLQYKKCTNQNTSTHSHCADSLEKSWQSILHLDQENKRTDAAPTLPILPIPSLYNLFMQREKLIRREEMEVYCAMTRKRWGNRFECV